jgi:DNA-binding phage protein
VYLFSGDFVLKDPAEAATYLDAVLEDGDLEHILLALKNVAEARSSSTAYPANANSSTWESRYQTLASRKVPELPVIATLLGELGLKLSVTVSPDQAA